MNGLIAIAQASTETPDNADVVVTWVIVGLILMVSASMGYGAIRSWWQRRQSIRITRYPSVNHQQFATDGYQLPFVPDEPAVKQQSRPKPAPSSAYQAPAVEYKAPVNPVEKAVKAPEEDEITLAVATRNMIDNHVDRYVELQQTDGFCVPIMKVPHEWYAFDLAAEKHYGVFGTSGAGKGNILTILALSILEMGPENVELIVLDAKDGVDYSFVDYVEHGRLYTYDTLEEGISYIEQERSRRNQLLRESHCRNVQQYYEKTGIRLKYMGIIVDELRGFTDAQRERLAKSASMIRSSGGIFWFSTQHPKADVIPTSIQAVISERIALRVVSASYSAHALGRRAKEDVKTFEPSAIHIDEKGYGVIRIDGGKEFIGRAPELKREVYDQWMLRVMTYYPRLDKVPSSVSQEDVIRAQNLPELRTQNSELASQEPTDDEKRMAIEALLDLFERTTGKPQKTKVAKMLKGNYDNNLSEVQWVLDHRLKIAA